MGNDESSPPLTLLAGLAVPASAVARPDHADERAAKQGCKVERGPSKATREAFRARYGSRERCILKRTAEEHAENDAANKNAAKECKAERDDPLFAEHHQGKTFQDFYGTNENLKNAYDKCVSSKAKARKDEMDTKDENEAEEFKDAAKKCAAERGEIGREAFAAEYGNNHHRLRAFGKCVSKKAREPND
jgi:hypothetical protein